MAKKPLKTEDEEVTKNSALDDTTEETPVARTRERPADDASDADQPDSADAPNPTDDTPGEATNAGGPGRDDEQDQKSEEPASVADDALVSSEEGSTVAQNDPLNATATDGGRNEFFEGLFEGETPEQRDERLRKAHEGGDATTAEEVVAATVGLPMDRVARTRGHLEVILSVIPPPKVRVLLNEDSTGNDGEVFDLTSGETLFHINYGSTPKGRTTAIRDDLTSLGVDLAQIEFYGVSASYKAR